MNYLINIIVFSAGGAAGAAIVIFLLKKWVTERLEQSIRHEYQKKLEDYKANIKDIESKSYEVWLLKRSACVKALRLANAILSNYSYANISNKEITPQYMSIEDARSCIDELACSCLSKEVLETLKKVLFEPVSPDVIVDLRNAVRKELDFSTIEIDTDRTKAFLGKINCSAPQ